MRPLHLWKTINRQAAPDAAGVYAIFEGARLVYIGSGISIRRRLNDHGIGRSWKRSERRYSRTPSVTVKAAGTRKRFDWLTREARLIERLQPRDNTIHRRGRS